MAYDPERFRRAYLPDELPLALADGSRIVRIASDRVRSAIDLGVQTPDGRTLTVFVERAVEGGRCFARTARLAVSYYADPGLDHGLAAKVARTVVELLTAREASVSPDGLDRALSVDLERSVTGRARTLELRINRECNERCAFCNTPEDSDTILPGPRAVHAAIVAERAAGYEEVTFTGREPTLDPELPAYLRAARGAGYRVVRVQTNGTSFAAESVLERLVEAGMTAAEISLHTLDAPTFGRLVGPRRLLDKTLAGLANLARLPDVEVHLVCVLTRLNLDHLAGVLERAAAVHPRIAQVTVSPMAPVGDGAARLDLVPRLGALRAPLEAALSVAARHRLRIALPSRCGAPVCALPAGAEHLSAELGNAPGQTLEAAKAKGPACSACAMNDRCTGVWRAYLDRYGHHELHPLPAMPDMPSGTRC